MFYLSSKYYFLNSDYMLHKLPHPSSWHSLQVMLIQVTPEVFTSFPGDQYSCINLIFKKCKQADELYTVGWILTCSWIYERCCTNGCVCVILIYSPFSNLCPKSPCSYGSLKQVQIFRGHRISLCWGGGGNAHFHEFTSLWLLLRRHLNRHASHYLRPEFKIENNPFLKSSDKI